ncbi:LPS-assembly lipoprotein LptE [endosymbiont of Lamellibrachia barhami]|uniref:LPS-assembly lipoprotein LptE n=1 Tax=endosymbiont of Lamellibrachia barhami TaxID=205975 RepID=UPI0015AEF804|nr:LPS assembly lipoprotein LptE [endosymbiont of Lamellibrachia barhami]
MRARRWRSVFYLSTLLILAGCGFHLKGYHQATPNLNGLFVENGENRKSLAGVLQRDLRASGVALAADAAEAKNRLSLTEIFKYRVLSVDENGKALEYELRLKSDFFVVDREGKAALPDQHLELVRELTYSGTDELGRRNEAKLVRGDMRTDMADQIVRRLQAQLN